MDFNHRMDASEASALERTWRTGNKRHKVMGLIGNDPTHPEGSGFTVRPGSPAPAQTHIAPPPGLDPATNGFGPL